MIDNHTIRWISTKLQLLDVTVPTRVHKVLWMVADWYIRVISCGGNLYNSKPDLGCIAVCLPSYKIFQASHFWVCVTNLNMMWSRLYLGYFYPFASPISRQVVMEFHIEHSGVTSLLGANLHNDSSKSEHRIVLRWRLCMQWNPPSPHYHLPCCIIWEAGLFDKAVCSIMKLWWWHLWMILINALLEWHGSKVTKPGLVP